MRDVEQVSSLIGDLYDAALDPRLWIGVLGKARDFLQSPRQLIERFLPARASD
jgi:hypothetical protein